MMLNRTHREIERIACLAGWDNLTLLLLISRRLDEKDQADGLIEHLSTLAVGEDEQQGGG